MTTAAEKIAAAQERMAEHGGMHIGDLVGWNAKAIDVARSVAKDVFAAAGLPDLVADIEASTALWRAARSAPKREGLLVRPFAKHADDTPVAYGIYVRKAGEGEKGDGWTCGARCRIAQGQIVALAPEGSVGEQAALDLAASIAARANHLLSHAETRDLTDALVGAVKTLSGVPLRENGGLYLLPPSKAGTFAALLPGLRALGVRPIRIEMHDAPDNVSSAAEAAKGALEADIAALLEDLKRASAGEIGKLAVANRVRMCGELKARADLFRDVLQGVVDEIGTRCDEVAAAFDKVLAGECGEDDGLFDVPVADEPTPAPESAPTAGDETASLAA